jgi:N-methylhydantoinase A/oxoprolinase/acetone carboxylase beta subunit
MKIGIGIDTGGTYTDAVIYDFTSRKILGCSKSLTTRQDLTVGILESLDALPFELVKEAEMVSLSTTLATNACVEDRGGNAKLIFLGIEPKVVDEFGGAYGLPSSNEIYIQDSFTKFSGEIEREPDWDKFRANIRTGFDGLDGVGIIEKNGTRNGGAIERKARDIVRQEHDVPVVCAHELFGELNCLQRGASTLLNARLIPIIHEFMQAVKAAMASRGVKATISMVRSDGSLMSDAVAQVRPVETLLCGPAASVIGSAFLGKVKNCLVTDMGGTTTDIALIKDGEPVKAATGITIGRWRTLVDGLYIKTVGLGGDTAVHYNKEGIFLEEYRIVPLSTAAKTYPHIVDNLVSLPPGMRKFRGHPYEHYTLIKDITGSPRYSDGEKELCTALKERPLIQRELTAKARMVGVKSMDLNRLINEGVVQAIGLTPTDVMHIVGDFDKYSSKASLLAAEFASAELGVSVDEFCARVYSQVKKRFYESLVKVMLENKNDGSVNKELGEDIKRSISESYGDANYAADDALVKTLYQTDFALIGAGAPTHIFLDDIARMLATKAVLPKYHEVANALGAIVSNVHATCMVEVALKTESGRSSGYAVYAPLETRYFDALDDAEAFALAQAEQGARREALVRGAQGEVALSSKVDRKEIPIDGSAVFLESRATAQAFGSMGF